MNFNERNKNGFIIIPIIQEKCHISYDYYKTKAVNFSEYIFRDYWPFIALNVQHRVCLEARAVHLVPCS